MKKYQITQIVWDTDGEDIDLPTEMIAIVGGDSPEDELSDYLSDNTGFCHFGFSYQEIP